MRKFCLREGRKEAVGEGEREQERKCKNIGSEGRARDFGSSSSSPTLQEILTWYDLREVRT